MASAFIVPVVQLQNIRPHPNAEKLELADALGYQMCIPKGRHQNGDTVVYFPADSCIPDEWAVKFGVKAYLKGKNQDRVGRMRLRGEPSFGLCVPLPEGVDWKVGDNVAEYFKAKKYEPPPRITCGDAAERDPLIDPFFERFTDVQNGRMFTDVFTDGEPVIITEKIHGSNCKLGRINNLEVAGSMSVRRKRPDEAVLAKSTYWYPWTLQGVRELINSIPGNAVLLYGEVYGPGIQSLAYGVPQGDINFMAFGLRVDGRFLDWDEFYTLCQKYNVPVVPVLYCGPFSLAKAKECADGKSTLADNIREGCVVYPLHERIDPKIDRAILKYIGTEYELSKHKDSDTTDV